MVKKVLKRGKAAAIIILIFVLIALVALFIMSRLKDKETTVISTSTPSTATSTQAVQTPDASKTAQSATPDANWKSYSNSQYHFGLEFAEGWENYAVVANQNLPLKAVASFGFKVKNDTPLTIYIFNQTDFESASQDFSSTEITRANSYVYSYRTWDSAPADSILTDKSIADVIKTFKTSN